MPDVTNAPTGVLCLGRTYCDLVFTGLPGLPVLGREVFADDIAVVPGGGAFITAAHLASLGCRAFLVSRLGLDPLSSGLESTLAGSGVDLAFLERAGDAGPQVTVAIVQPQDRAFLSRRAGHGRPATLEAALAARGVRHLHIAEYATLAEIPGLIAKAKGNGLSISLDPSWDDSLIRDPALIGACKGIDLFLPNVEEACAITRMDDPADALEHLSQHFPLVILKKGAGGAALAEGRSRLSLEAPRVAVVDTTGAGDAFNAGFLQKWLKGDDLQSCLAAAIDAGSLSVQAVGGATVLKRSDNPTA